MDNGHLTRYATYARYSSDLQRRQTSQSQTRSIIFRTRRAEVSGIGRDRQMTAGRWKSSPDAGKNVGKFVVDNTRSE